MKKKFFIVLFCFFTCSNLFSSSYYSEIKIKIEILDDKLVNSSSSARGDNMLEFNGYRLFNIISEITEIPIEYFYLEGNSMNPLIKFKATSKNKIDKEELIKELNHTLNNELNIAFSYVKSERIVKVIYSLDKNKLKKCTNSESKKESSLMILNRTLKGKCISMNQLINQINDWYSIKIVNEFDKTIKYNFEIHHSNSFEELQNELKFYYSLDIKTEKRYVRALSIVFKN